MAVDEARAAPRGRRRRTPCRPAGASAAGPTQATRPPSTTRAASSTMPEQPPAARGSLVTSSPMSVISALGARRQSSQILRDRRVELAPDLAPGRPCRTTTRPSTITWVTSSAAGGEDGGALVGAGAGGARAGGVEGDQVGALARRRSGRRRRTRARRARRAWRRRAARPRSSARAAWVASRSSSSTARISSNEVDDGVAVACRGSAGRPASCERRGRADAVAEVALGGRAEAGAGAAARRAAGRRRRSGGWRARRVVSRTERPRRRRAAGSG